MTDEQKQELQQKMGEAFYADVLRLEHSLKEMKERLDEATKELFQTEEERIRNSQLWNEELQRNAFLREELKTALRAQEAAEFSRDTIRAHAQAALNKYRAQDDLFEELVKLAWDRQASPFLEGVDYHRGFTDAVAMLETKRAAYKAVK